MEEESDLNNNFNNFNSNGQNDFSHLEDDNTKEVGSTIAHKKQVNAQVLGFLIMGVKLFYSDNFNTNGDLHLPYKDEFNQILEKYLDENYKIPKIRQITSGHEHGTSNNKCHYQVCVEFEIPCRISIGPFEFKHNDTVFLGMCQKAKNSFALRKYCMKDKDFNYLYPEKAIEVIKKIDPKTKREKVDPYATVFCNRDKFVNSEEALDHILSNDPRTGIVNYRNIQYALNEMIKQQVPEFKWTFPAHLEGMYPLIEDWFKQFCVPEGNIRRKCLVLYSPQRAVGKTRFAQSLVPHDAYYIIFRNTFTNEALKGKEHAKLLILDDMAHYTKENKEIWKALMASEQTSIRDCYANFLFPHQLPCIITTNNKQMFLNFLSDNDFRTQGYFVEISSYMGPSGTEPVCFHERKMDISEDLEGELKVKEEERIKFKEDKIKEKEKEKTTFRNKFNNY